MMNRAVVVVVAAGLVGAGQMAGCNELPGKKREQGAVIGGAGGAVAGAALSKNNRLLGALIGGALGAGGGYLIGVQAEKSDPENRDEAVDAAKSAERNPATAAQARNAATADINNDGFVTLDEVVAMQEAGFDDAEMIRRLRATNQIFELTTEQEKFLTDRGVSQAVVTQMREINKAERDRLLNERQDVISRPQ